MSGARGETRVVSKGVSSASSYANSRSTRRAATPTWFSAPDGDPTRHPAIRDRRRSELVSTRRGSTPCAASVRRSSWMGSDGSVHSGPSGPESCAQAVPATVLKWIASRVANAPTTTPDGSSPTGWPKSPRRPNGSLHPVLRSDIAERTLAQVRVYSPDPTLSCESVRGRCRGPGRAQQRRAAIERAR